MRVMGVLGVIRSRKAPNSKLQHPMKRQTSSSKSQLSCPYVSSCIASGRRVIGSLLLEFLWSLDVGIWRFSSFHIPYRRETRHRLADSRQLSRCDYFIDVLVGGACF